VSILSTIGGILTSSTTGGIVSAVGAAAKTAEAIAEKSQQGQLIDAGEARGLATNLQAIHEQLQKFKAVADLVDSDPEYAQRVLDTYTIHD
jgi:hypothetical protein